MNDKEKRQWIIRYARRNDIDDILAGKYKNSKRSFLKEHSDEIQSICSIISVLVIGIASILIAAQYNSLVDKQTQIMRHEQKPIIGMKVQDADEYTDKLLIVNNGTEAINYNVEIFPFFDVLCNENNMGSVPIRVYFLNEIKDIKRRNTDEIAEITLYKESHPPIISLKKDLSNLICEYVNLYWDFSFTYLIKVTSTDILDEQNTAYFIYNREGVQRVRDEYACTIINECTCTIESDYGTRSSKESFFILETSSAEDIFKYTLNKIRANNLYQVDFSTGEKYLYGEYEPTK